MQRDRPRVGHVPQRRGVVHDEVVDVPPRVLRIDTLRADPGRSELRCVLLEEGLAGDPVGVAREHEGPVTEIRQDQRRHAIVVGHQIALGVALGGPEDLLEIGQLDDPLLVAARGRRRSRRDCSLSVVVLRRRERHLAPAVFGALLASQDHEDRVPDSTVLRPVAEAHLADQLGLHPVVASAFRNLAGVEGWRGSRERLELFPEAFESLLIEAGADLRDVGQAPVVIQAHMQRAEVAA